MGVLIYFNYIKMFIENQFNGNHRRQNTSYQTILDLNKKFNRHIMCLISPKSESKWSINDTLLDDI